MIQVYDTAFEEGEGNDYSARTTWGVLGYPDVNRRMRHSCVLLEAWRGRVGFPALRAEAVRAYKEHKPDRVLVEKKASGHSLIQELRRAGVPVTPIQAEKDKVTRAYTAQIMLEQGCVLHPDRRWAQDVINEAADFPSGEHDDWTDTCVHAWTWLRRTYQLQLVDEPDDDEESKEVRLVDMQLG